MITKDDMMLILKFFLIGFVVLFLMLYVSVIVSAQTISPGECYAENISVGINETYNQSFMVCAEDVFFDINMTLQPGQTKKFNTSFYNITGHCTTENLSTDKCIIEKELEPGDTLEILTATCDVKIDVDDNADCPEIKEGIPTTYKEEFTIRFSNVSQRLQINFADDEYVTQVSNNLDIVGEMSYTCPTEVINDTIATQITAERCRALGEVYCGDAFELMANKFDASEEQRGVYERNLDQCRRDMSDMVERSVCINNEKYAQLLADKQAAQNESESCSFQEGRLARDIERLNGDKAELTFFAIFLGGLSAYLYFKPAIAKKMSAMG